MPFGVVGYLSGLVVRIPLSTVMQVLILLIPALFFVDGLTTTSIAGWLTFGWVLVLGLLATLPLAGRMARRQSGRHRGGWVAR